VRYAGRLTTDPVNTITQTENSIIEGGGTQTGTCGGTCTRWGDYSAMTLDVDGCTFWYTNEYYQASGLNDNTRIGSFAFPECTPVTTGTLQGTVTKAGPSPLAGVTVTLGSRTTTTDAAGLYTFAGLPAGTYPSLTVSLAGFVSQTAVSIAVAEGATTTRNFTLGPAPLSACFTDTTQADFQTGVQANCDLTSSPGDLSLTNVPPVDQQQLVSSGTGTGITTTQWLGQTFVPSVSGSLVKLDLSLFCSACSGANPSITVEIRTVSGGLPTTTVLATTTITGFSSGSSTFYTAAFASPAALVSGTSYAFTMRITTTRTGTYAGIFSTGPSAYPNGDRVVSTNSGASWVVNTSNPGATARDLMFRTYIFSGFARSGSLVSSIKDANPETGRTATWGTLSWNATVPANTGLQFQVAASANVNGPFTFVGPDGTAATFFSSTGASLAQFSGVRYLKYKALLTSSDGSATPTINDVTVCVVNVGNPVPAITTLNPSSVVEGSGAFTLTVTGTNFLSTSVVRVNGSDRVTTFGSATEVTAAILAADVLTAGSNPAITVFNPTPDGGTSNSLTLTITTGVAASITTQPGSQTIASGSTATMSVVADGSPALTYQWYTGTSGDTANPIGGAVSSSYTTPTLTTTTNYWVRVTNRFGTADSNTATITIGAGAIITTQPQSQAIASGSTATMTVAASGTPTPTYQWYLGTSGDTSSPIGGATSTSYTTPPLTSGANYWARASNTYGTADSNTAAITVGVAPSITTQPQDRTIPGGTAAIMTATASGTATLTYQWYVGTSGNTASPIGGATSNRYTASPLTTTSYWMRASNPFGTANSSTATITVVCGFTLTPASARFGPAGGSGSAVVRTQAGCTWNASTPAAWIVLGASSGIDGGTMTFTAQPNPTGIARSSSIVLGMQTFVVTERVRDTITQSDFDGDSKADIAVYRPSTGNWHVLNSSTGSTTSRSVSWGLSTDTPMPGDYDGDGRIDPAIFRPSTGLWAVLNSSTNYTTSYSVSWGLPGDVPMPGDYDGDGKTDPAVYRPCTGEWHILRSSTGYTSSVSVSWGLAGSDVPMPGDYDGDGRTDPAIFRPSTGLWAFLRSSANYGSSTVVSWGLSSDVAVPGDYDGDGKADPAVYRPSTGVWYFLKSSTGYGTSAAVSWGLSTDVPVPADYDGDGRFDPAIFRPSTGLWAVLKSSTNYGAAFVTSWGLSTDTPINRRP
jgi:hypothetical protein